LAYKDACVTIEKINSMLIYF